MDDLVKHTNLRVLDLRNNRLTKYDPEFTELIRKPGGKGLDIKYEGKWNIFTQYFRLEHILFLFIVYLTSI